MTARVLRNPIEEFDLIKGANIPKGCFFSYVEDIQAGAIAGAENYRPLTPQARKQILLDVQKVFDEKK